MSASDAEMEEKIVLVEDDRELRTFLMEALEDEGYRVSDHATAESALAEIRDGRETDLVVTDLIMPGMRGHELVAELRKIRPELNVIVITAYGSISSAIDLIKAGAYDYLPKPVSEERLLAVIRRALEESELRRKVARLSRDAGTPPDGFVGASRAMQELFERLGKAAESDQPVLITGETGTGKELVARAVHRRGATGRFVPVNCGALPENLLESELFGHAEGAFTDASQDKVGLFEEADGGTLFLDEIGELPASLQPKLLRALEQGEVRRVGETRSRTYDARTLAATNQDLEQKIAEGEFREDLYWRLNVLRLEVPPLRDRRADIPLLAEHFLAESSGSEVGPERISSEAMAVLTAYSWPGNVRELKNVVERAVALTEATEIRPEDLPERIREEGRAAALVERAAGESLTLDELERAYIYRIMDRVGGNKSRAAELLGIDRTTLYRKLERYEERVDDPR